jgi:hypothetical protein
VWAIEDLEQDIGLIYRSLGQRGLAAIPGVSSELAERLGRDLLGYSQA